MPPIFNRQRFIEILIITLFFIVWQWRYSSVKIDTSSLPSKVKIVAVLNEVPYRASYSQRFRLGQVTVTTRAWPEYSFGQLLQVEGILEPNLLIKYPRIQVLSQNQASQLAGGLISFRQKLAGLSKKFLPEPQAGLVNGFLLGIKSGLGGEFEEQLRRAGLTHAVVVSGYNLNILAGGVSAGTVWLGRFGSFAFSSLALVAFSLMVGCQPPVARALAMSLLALWGKYLGRPRSALRLLLVGGLVLIVIDPLLPFSLSFQLSFLAVLGLLLFEPVFSAGLFRISAAFGRPNHSNSKDALPLEGTGAWPFGKIKSGLAFILREFLTILSAQILIWPLLAFNFGTFSWLSFPSNMLVGWTIPFSMLFGFLMMLGGIISPFLGTVLSWPAWVCLTYFVRIVDLLTTWWTGQLTMELGGWFLWVYYVLLAVGYWVWHQRTRNTK